MPIAPDQPISTSNLKAAFDAAEMRWGGGLVDYRFLFYGTDKSVITAPVKIADLDLDKFDLIYCKLIADISNVDSNNARKITLPFTDGVFVCHSSSRYTEYGFVPTRQGNCLWTLRMARKDTKTGKVTLLSDKYNPSSSRYCFKLVYAWRDLTKTKTTEVSTMAVTNDQPISAGNLKAALDGLTGGVAPES